MKMRKDPLVKLNGIKEPMAALGLTTRELGDRIGLDSDHVGKIINGSVGTTSQVMFRLARVFGPIEVEMDGLVGEFQIRESIKGGHEVPDISLAEAGWMVKEQQDEAETLLPRLLQAARVNDRNALVYLYREIICDTRRASEILETLLHRAIGASYDEIRNMAIQEHPESQAA